MLHVKAFLFDMDGTLVDSTAVVENEWHRFSAQFGLNVQDVIAYAHGRQTLDTVIHFIGEGDMAQKVASELDARELVTLKGINAISGAEHLLSRLPPERWALVTSAGRQLAVNRMKAAGLPLPDIMICAEDVENGKPSPEGYLKAALQLGRNASECLVLEDAEAGIQAGIASGAYVIAVDPNADVAQGAFARVSLADLTVTPTGSYYEVSWSTPDIDA